MPSLILAGFSPSVAVAQEIPASTLPTGGQVTYGAANFDTQGNTLNIQQSSQNAAINWQSFSIGRDATVQFQQPSTHSVTLNRVVGNEASVIDGALKANGQVFVTNSNGVLFNKSAQVNVGGIVASTLTISDADFAAGRYTFEGNGGRGSVINKGSISSAEGGYVGLIGTHVGNEGVIATHMGSTVLASGDQVSLKIDGDSLTNVTVDKSTLNALVENKGAIIADGGQVLLQASAANSLLENVVNNEGVIRARSISRRNGVIRLEGNEGITHAGGTLDASGDDSGEQGGTVDVLGKAVEVTDGAHIDVSGRAGGGTARIGGDYQGSNQTVRNAEQSFVSKDSRIDARAIDTGDGGKVIVWADKSTHFYGNVDARGGATGGDGGFVEVSGKEYLNYKGYVDTTAAQGDTGMLLLDPADIVIANGTADSALDGSTTFAGDPSGVAGVIASGDTGPTTLYESELQGIAATSNISLTSTNSIIINDLIDNSLSLLQNGGRSVTFSTGAGGFTMLDTNDTISLAGGALNITAGGTSTIGNIATGGGLTTFNIATGGVATVAGTISGTGGLTKNTGTGTLVLNGANTYSGTTILSAGTLQVGDDTALGTGTLNLNGGTLQGNGTPRTLANTLTHTVASFVDGASDLTFSGLFGNTSNLTLTNNNSGNTTFNNVDISNNATNRTLTFSGTGTTTINGVIANGGTSTAGALVKSGTGTLALNGANTYSGTTTLRTGTLQVGSNTALGTGTLQLEGGTLQGNGTAHSLANTITHAASSFIGGTSDLTFSGVFNNAQNFTLTNNNSGNTIFNNVNISNTAANRTLTITGTGNTTINGVLANGGTSTAGALVKSGTGTLIFNGANTYGGATTLSGGTLQLGTNNGLLSGNVLTIASNIAGGTALFDLNGFDQTIGALTFGGAASTPTSTNIITTGAGTLTLGGNLTYTSTGDPLASTISGNLSLGSATPTFTINDSANATNDLIIDAIISGTGGFTKTGAGTLVLNGANTYSGTTTLTAGTIQVGSNTALGTGTLSLDGATLQGNGTAHSLANTITHTAASFVDGTSDLTFTGLFGNTNSYTLTNNNSGSTSFNNVEISNSATNRTLTFGGTGNTTINGVIANGSTSTAGGLAKSGTGMLIINGNNTYGGATTINNGTLRLGANNVLPSTTSVTVRSNVAGATALFDLNGFDQTIGTLTFGGTGGTSTSISNVSTGAGTLTLGGNVTYTNTGSPLASTISGNLALGSGTRTFTINDSTNADSDLIIDAIISGTGNLSKTGAGTLVLNGANTYSGTTTLTAGTLEVGSNTALGTGTLSLNGGTLQGDGTARSLANTITHAAASFIGGTSDLTFSGLFGNTINLTLTNNNSGSTTFNNVDISNSATNRTLTFGGTGTTTINGVIANGSTSTAGALAKSGTGTLILNGNNTYGGATTVSGGTLQLGAADRINNNSALTIDAGAIFDFAGFSETLASIINNGSVWFGTGNTITTAGAQTYTGAVSGGSATLVSSGGGDITLTNSANDLTGTLGITTTGSASVSDANALSLGTVSANLFEAHALGGDLTLTGAINASGTTGTPLTLTTSGHFVNSYGASALSIGGGRWLVYSATPVGDTRGGLGYAFKQYDASYGDSILGAGNGFIYALAPTLTPILIGSTTKTYDGSLLASVLAGNYDVTGAVDGDTITITGTSASYDTANAGIGKTVTASGVSLTSATDGAATVYGYGLGSTSASGSIGTIDRADLTLSTSDVTRAYNGTLAAAGNAIVTSGTLFTNASNGNTLDSISGGSFAFTDANVGTGKTVTTSGVTLSDGNGGGNYNVLYADNTNSTIGRANLTLSTSDVTRVYNGTLAAAGNAIVTSGTLFTNASNGNTLDSISGGSFAFTDANVGTGKTVTTSGVTLSDGNGGGNYNVLYADNTNSSILPAPIPAPGPTIQPEEIESVTASATRTTVSQLPSNMSTPNHTPSLVTMVSAEGGSGIAPLQIETYDTGIRNIYFVDEDSTAAPD